MPSRARGGVAEDSGRLSHLGLGAGHEYLTRRHQHLTSGEQEFTRRYVGAAIGVLPGPPQLLALLIDQLASRVGERVGAPRARRVRRYETLVLELLQDRVDQAGARSPRLVRAFAELLDQLVPVAGLLLEQDENRRSNIAAALTSKVATQGHATLILLNVPVANQCSTRLHVAAISRTGCSRVEVPVGPSDCPRYRERPLPCRTALRAAP